MDTTKLSVFTSTTVRLIPSMVIEPFLIIYLKMDGLAFELHDDGIVVFFTDVISATPST